MTKMRFRGLGLLLLGLSLAALPSHCQEMAAKAEPKAVDELPQEDRTAPAKGAIPRAMDSRVRIDFYRAKLQMPTPPYLNRAVPLEVELDPVSHAPETQIHLILPEGIRLLSERDRETYDLRKGEKLLHTFWLEVLEPGNYRLEVRVSNVHFSGFDRSYFIFLESFPGTARSGPKPFKLREAKPRHLLRRVEFLNSEPLSAMRATSVQESTAETVCGTGNVLITGRVLYTNEDATLKWIRYATIEVWGTGLFDWSPLGSCTSDSQGLFGVRISLSGSKDLFVRAKSESSAQAKTVSCGLLGCDVYTGDTPAQNVDPNNSSSWDFGSASSAADDSPPWQAMDNVIDENQWIANGTGGASRSQVVIEYPSNNCQITGCSGWPCSNGDRIYLPDKFVNACSWDRRTVIHEYAHSVMYSFYGNSFPGGCSSPPEGHRLFSETCEGFAITEGWAEFMEAAVDNDPGALVDVASGCSNSPNNAETNWWRKGPNCDSQNNGAIVEGAVASILWDIFDSPSPDDDPLQLGFNDSLGSIWTTLMGANPSTSNPQGMNAFWDTWFTRYGFQQPMWAIYYANGINKDSTPPTGSVSINGGASSTTSLIVSLSLSATDDLSGMGTGAQMEFSNDDLTWSSPEPLSTSKPSWDLSTYGGNSSGGLKTVYVRFRDAAGNWSLSFTASITYTTVTLSTTSLSFATQMIGTTSAAQTVTVTNSGTTSLTISTVTIAGTNPGDFAKSADTCSGASVPSSGTCTVRVTFTPTAAGQRSAILSIADNAPDTPQSASLTGTGTDFAVSVPAGGDSATVTAGDPATYNLSIAPSGFVGTAALTCTWQGTQPRGTNCTVSPTSVNLDGANPAPFTVKVTTTARSLAGPRPDNLPPMNRRQHDVLLVVLMLGLIMLIARDAPRRRKAYLGLTVSLLLAGLWVSCGGGGGGGAPPPPQTGTPAGTYSLTITATASGVSRSTTLTLKVN
jgi:hypothetical protein